MDIRAFVSNPTLADNTIGVTAPFGELSSYALTYTKARQNFSTTPANGIELVVFSSRNDSGAETTLATAIANQLLTVGNYVYTAYTAGTIPRNINKTQFISTLTTQFPTCSNFVIGTLLAGSLTTKNMPDYISFKTTIGGVIHTAKLWFANASFLAQYDLYSIQVFPPVQTLSSLIGTPAAVTSAILSAQSATALVAQIQAATQYTPASTINTYNLPLVLGSSVVQTSWLIICWGNAGGDESLIKDAIRTYINANSTGITWSTYYPALYAESEFTIIPMWGNLPVSSTDFGTYSALMNINDIRSQATGRLSAGYTNAGSGYLNNNLAMMSVPYRSLLTAVIGHPSNPSGKTSLTAIYKDYIDVDTQSTDFGRMEQDTQDFILALRDALDECREFMPNNAVPAGYVKHISEGRLFLSFVQGQYRFRVLTRYGFNNLI